MGPWLSARILGLFNETFISFIWDQEGPEGCVRWVDFVGRVGIACRFWGRCGLPGGGTWLPFLVRELVPTFCVVFFGLAIGSR